MKRKMLALAILLGITVFASSAPRTEAAIYCGIACSGQYSNTVCYCPSSSDRPGWGTTCGAFKRACYF